MKFEFWFLRNWLFSTNVKISMIKCCFEFDAMFVSIIATFYKRLLRLISFSFIYWQTRQIHAFGLDGLWRIIFALICFCHYQGTFGKITDTCLQRVLPACIPFCKSDTYNFGHHASLNKRDLSRIFGLSISITCVMGSWTVAIFPKEKKQNIDFTVIRQFCSQF